jgi:monothiol glutaredoxin
MSSVNDRIENLLNENKYVLFMKGNPESPMCGFSARACEILKVLGVSFKSVDVLQDSEIREGIKSYGNWPTIPQFYANKELVGGSDIMMEMYEAGELQTVVAQ